jgi:hypothetical protein
LKSHSDLKAFLDFEKKQTTAPEELKNPPGHYRRVVAKFDEFRSKRRDWEIREQRQLRKPNSQVRRIERKSLSAPSGNAMEQGSVGTKEGESTLANARLGADSRQRFSHRLSK